MKTSYELFEKVHDSFKHHRFKIHFLVSPYSPQNNCHEKKSTLEGVAA